MQESSDYIIDFLKDCRKFYCVGVDVDAKFYYNINRDFDTFFGATNWTADKFSLAPKPLLEKLRDFLRRHRVFIPCRRGLSIASGLTEAANRQRQHFRWSLKELQKQEEYERRHAKNPQTKPHSEVLMFVEPDLYQLCIENIQQPDKNRLVPFRNNNTINRYHQSASDSLQNRSTRFDHYDSKHSSIALFPFRNNNTN